MHSPIQSSVSDQQAIESMAQRADLLRSLERYCACIEDAGVITSLCPGHEAVRSAMFVRHMEFARTLTQRVVVEEFCTHPTRTDDECDVCGDIRLTSEFSHRLLREMDDAA